MELSYILRSGAPYSRLSGKLSLNNHLPFVLLNTYSS